MNAKFLALGALALVAVMLPASPAGAAREGDLDPSFGGGNIKTSIGDVTDVANGAAIQPDGKIVVAGQHSDGPFQGDISVVRYTTSGALDPTFDHDGIKTTSIGSDAAVANAVALQSDGKIVVAGFTGNLGSNVALLVARYTPGGSLDPTFDHDGIATLKIGGAATVATALTVQPDGKIVVAGFFNGAGAQRFAVVRYTSGGNLDSSFDHEGIQNTTDITSGGETADAVGLLSNGEIAVAGTTFFPADFAVALYHPDGSLDTHFGGTGSVTTDIFDAAKMDAAAGIVIQRDNKILVTGSTNSSQAGAVVRYRTDGSRDPGFGEGGTASVVDPDSNAGVTTSAVGIQRDGKIIVAGGKVVAASSKMFVSRLTANGRLDRGFGSDSMAVAGPLGGFSTATALALQSDGKIIVAGEAGTASDNIDIDVARLKGDTTGPWGARVLGLPRVSLGAQTVSWLASDTGTGVRAFDVRRESANSTASTFGRWTTFQNATTNVSGTLPFGPAGTTECVEARGRDFAGNIGSYSAPACTTFPLDDRALTIHGTWTKSTNTANYLGTALTSKTAGAYLQTTGTRYFRHLAVIATTCPSCGSVGVFVNGVAEDLILLSSPKTRTRQVLDVTFPGPTVLRHGTIKLEALNAGQPVVIDGIAIGLS